MKCIIVIKAMSIDIYHQAREDLEHQMKAKGWEVPLFCFLPSDYPGIEIVWLDEDMEKTMFSEALQETINNESRPTL